MRLCKSARIEGIGKCFHNRELCIVRFHCFGALERVFLLKNTTQPTNIKCMSSAGYAFYNYFITMCKYLQIVESESACP